MLEFAEKLVLSGMGALTLGQHKVGELAQEVRERFNLSEEEGKKLVTRIQNAVDENQKKLEALALEEVKKACARLGLLTPEHIAPLEQRLAALEARVKKQEAPSAETEK